MSKASQDKQAQLWKKITHGRTDQVIDWIALELSPSATDDMGVSLLQWCCYFGDVCAIRLLIEQGAIFSRRQCTEQLHGAAFHGHRQLCQFLLEQGAEANAVNSVTGETPLHAATSIANRPVYDLIIELLLANGSNPNQATIAGKETECFMRDSRTKGETPLHRAAAFASDRSIQRIIDAGGDVQLPDQNGDTPLSWASWHLRPDRIIRRLCFDPHSLHPDRQSQYDHGRGWRAMDFHLMGRFIS